MSKKLKTNTDLIVDLMERSPHGALCQAFIIQAVEQFAKQVAAKTPADFDNAMISGKSWHGIGVDITKRIAEFYGRSAP